MKNLNNNNQNWKELVSGMDCFQLLTEQKKVVENMKTEELNSTWFKSGLNKMKTMLEQLKTSNEKNRRFLEKRKLV